METIGKGFKYLLLALAVMVGIVGCNLVRIDSRPEPLPAVAPLPLPQLPDWIEQISPTGQAEPLAQILIRFKDPLIPVERIESPDQQKLLQKFEIVPSLPGKFRFLTPRMVGFQSDQALPKATRIQVTLKAGLADLDNHSLEEDLAWTFNTEAIQLTNLPGREGNMGSDVPPMGLEPNLDITSNVELDLDSVQKHLIFAPEGEQESIRFKVALKQEETSSEYQQIQETFDPSSRNWIYTITPLNSLKKDTTYRIEFTSGLLPLRGNLPSETLFISQIKTYAPLAFDKMEFYGGTDTGSVYGRFVKGSPDLRFNNPLVAESALKNITIKPNPKEKIPLLKAYDDSNVVSINPWALEPDTTYTITINDKLKDQFGQSLEKPVTLTYETGDVAPDLWAPSGLNIFPANTDLNLNITTVNLPKSQYQAAYKIVEPTDLVYNYSAYSLLSDPTDWNIEQTGGKKNYSYNNIVPLREKLGAATGMLGYKIKARTNSYKIDGKEYSREPQFDGLVQLTNLGVFAQWFPDSGLVRVHHLSDGSAVNNATVEIYKSRLEATDRPTPEPCAIAQTDETGTLIISGENWQQCISNREAPKLLIIVREGKDWAFARTDEYSGAYSYGIDAGWDSGQIQSKGTIFSDRQLYQPGEKAWFTGVAYYLRNGELKQDKNTSYQVSLINSDGKKTDLGTQTTNKFGTFSLEFTLNKNLPLGYYSINAKGKNGVEINGEFRVAEFKPPNFKVDLNLDKEFATIDQKITAKAESNYLFGSPVQGGNIKYYVTRTQTNFTPKGWEKFSFGRQWFWPENPPEVTTDVLQSNQQLDAAGKSTQLIPVAKDLPYPMTYRIDAQVSDVSNLSVSNTQTFTALPSDRAIGIQTDFVADAGKAFPIQIIVTDPTGKVISGERVRVELQEIKYSSVTQIREGSSTEHNQVEYKTVAEKEIRSGTTSQSVSLTPPQSGSYRIKANFANSRNDITASETQIWVTGETATYWGDRYTNNRLEIKLDKEKYKPGETATALIQSPYPEAELYFAVVRHNTIYKTIQKVKGSAPTIQFQVTPEMLPNAAVEAVLVRQGEPISKVEPNTVDNLVRIGFAPFSTSLEDKYLQVKVTSKQEKIEPASEETIELELKDDKGNPIQGQFTVMAVNEAVLQLTGYRPPDLVETVYAPQEISTRFADNRPDVVLANMSSPLEKGWGYGGGYSAGLADTRVRTDFRPTAYYNGSVLTDASGRASVTFTLPDDLTTWRVMAIATDENFHFGEGETTFITTKPLLSNPILPQFLRLGDRFMGGLSVTNTTGKTGELSVRGSLTDNLEFAKNSQLQTNAQLGTSAYRFPMVASEVGEGKVKFITQLNNSDRDAFEVPLEIKTLPVTEQAIESGTTEDSLKIPLNVDKEIVPDAGGLEISLASTLIPEITAPVRQVFEEDWLPFLEPAASQLAIAANLQILSQKYTQVFNEYNPTSEANQALENIQKLQQPDGGFAYLPDAKSSDPFVTPYVAEAIAKAKSAGIKINSRMVSRLQAYLKKILANPSQYEYCQTLSCKNQVRLEALMALAELGEKRSDFLSSLYEQWEEFDPVNQIKLARYLSQFPQWQKQAQNLSQQLQETIYETGRTAKINLPSSWSWFNSATTAQAQALRLFISQDAKPEVVNKALQGLLEMRRKGTWQTSYDNAQALTALVEYSKLQPTPPNFTATAQLDRQELAKARFQGYRNPNLEVKVPMAELPKGKNDLILTKSGQGTLHYLVAYQYRLQGNQPGSLNGLRVTRYIRAANEDKELRKTGIYDLDDPLTLPVGQVFDIGLEIISDRPVEKVIITDPLPAGFEAVDTSFQTSTSYFKTQQNSWQIAYQNTYKDRIVAYADSLNAGVYSLHYLVRSVTPGTFEWPGAEARLQYSPEEFGRCASSTLELKE
jgi:alpha-2-macroglobulin